MANPIATTAKAMTAPNSKAMLSHPWDRTAE
jgi:hypothetical protein